MTNSTNKLDEAYKAYQAEQHKVTLALKDLQRRLLRSAKLMARAEEARAVVVRIKTDQDINKRLKEDNF